MRKSDTPIAFGMVELPTNLLFFAGTYDDLVAQVQKAPGLVVVDFFAEWCPPSQRLSQQIPLLAREIPYVTFLKIDIDKSQALATHYGINSIPHLRYVKRSEGGGLTELAITEGVDIQQIKDTVKQFAK
jgi:thioredoxin 1